MTHFHPHNTSLPLHIPSLKAPSPSYHFFFFFGRESTAASTLPTLPSSHPFSPLPLPPPLHFLSLHFLHVHMYVCVWREGWRGRWLLTHGLITCWTHNSQHGIIKDKSSHINLLSFYKERCMKRQIGTNILILYILVLVKHSTNCCTKDFYLK